MATITTEPRPAKAKKPKPERQPKAPREPKAPRPSKDAKTPKTPVEKAPAPPAWASPVKPSLVLLPPKARGLKARRRAVRRAMFMSLGLLGLTAAGYLVVLAGTAGAQAELNKEKDITATSTQYLAQNRDVQDFANGFIERKAAAASALDQDVAYSKVVQSILNDNTVGVVFTSIKTSAAGSQCVSSSPFVSSTSLGCLDVEGKAKDVTSVAQLVSALNQDKTTLAEPYLTQTVAADSSVTFKLTVGYTSQALSLKGQKFKPSPEELSSLDTPTSAAGTTSTPATQGASK
ncbi:hypothetical protein GCM10023063_20340 [Arthrobacter methylotrophus]|uniref:Fimbrial assembly protein n=1 Tax=Arthrobacter methylotrophus TaxID=121291 RepID=A0ABV5UXL9_9MICC